LGAGRGAEKAGHSQVTIIDGSLICLVFLIAKINQIPETCISQISGILSYFAGFYPFVLEGLNAARLRS
jgi:hypothetical protein